MIAIELLMDRTLDYIVDYRDNEYRTIVGGLSVIAGFEDR